MRSTFIGESVPTFETERALEQRRVTIRDGRLFDWQGHPLFGRYLYVLLRQPDGELALYADRAGPPGAETMKHSSFNGGFPVAGAGIMNVEKGWVRSMDNGSGHYAPPGPVLRRTADWLVAQGASHVAWPAWRWMAAGFMRPTEYTVYDKSRPGFAPDTAARRTARYKELPLLGAETAKAIEMANRREELLSLTKTNGMLGVRPGLLPPRERWESVILSALGDPSLKTEAAAAALLHLPGEFERLRTSPSAEDRKAAYSALGYALGHRDLFWDVWVARSAPVQAWLDAGLADSSSGVAFAAAAAAVAEDSRLRQIEDKRASSIALAITRGMGGSVPPTAEEIALAVKSLASMREQVYAVQAPAAERLVAAIDAVLTAWKIPKIRGSWEHERNELDGINHLLSLALISDRSTPTARPLILKKLLEIRGLMPKDDPGLLNADNAIARLKREIKADGARPRSPGSR